MYEKLLLRWYRVTLSTNSGKLYGIFLDGNGDIIGNDGKFDNKRYVIKTTQTQFGAGYTAVPGAGLSMQEQEGTINFIRNNSGNTAAFEENNIAYRNSVEIEGGYENREAMKRIVRQDDGNVSFIGTRPYNNREFGGTNEDGNIIETAPGPVRAPNLGGIIYFTITNKTHYTFHSHPSGWLGVDYHIQHPSLYDIRVAGNMTNYVFGRGNRIVYIYNSQGVQATLPMNKF